MSTNAIENNDAAAANTPTAIEDVTVSLAKTTITPTEIETSAADAAHAASAAEGRRLYIGNLAYSTTVDELKEFFIGFDIESTSIPTNPRSGRPVGYAFVDLETRIEAERAISELSGQEVLGRKVSVQLARKPGTASAKREVYNNPDDQQQEDGEQSQHQGGRRNPRRGRVRGGRASGGRASGGKASGGRIRGGYYSNNSTATGEVTAEEGAAPTADALPPTEAFNTSEAVTGTEASDVAPTRPTVEGEGNTGSFKGGRRRGPPENGVPSATKVMVANLPYELTESELLELFAEYQPESAKIALRPIPRYLVLKLQVRGEPRKGRGFGFVTLASEEMQKKAVEEMNGKLVGEREIAVKVAIDNPRVEGENKEAREGEKQEGTEETKGEAKENGIHAERDAQPTAA